MAEQTHNSFCRFCEALCGIIVTTDGQNVLGVRGDPEDPLSHGYTCSKGRALGRWHHNPERLDVPQLLRGEQRHTVGWPELLGDLSTRIQEIIASYGRDAVGFYMATGAAFDANGRRTLERFRRALGTKSMYTATTIDTPSKPLVSELMSGHPGLFPALDREEAKLFLLLGVNPVVSHGHVSAFTDPVTTLRDMTARADVWVVDPRRTETARLATEHLAIRPGTDYALLAYLVREILDDGADTAYLDRHASGVEELRAAVSPFDCETAAARCGLERADLEALLAAVRRAGRISCQSGTGVTMAADANVAEWLLWALQIVTGSLDRPGGTWFNPGYLKQLDVRSFSPSNAEPQEGPDSRPDIPGRWGEIPCAAMTDEIEAGNLRALIVCGGNPVRSFPETSRVEAALGQLDVLAVADVIETDTTALATHVLPVAGQLERADIPLYIDQFVSCVSTRFTEAVVEPGAERKPMWWVFAELADRLGYRALPDGLEPATCQDVDLLRVIGDRSRSTFDHIAENRVVVEAPAVFGWVLDRVLPESGWRVAPAPLVRQLSTLGEPSPLVLITRRQPTRLNSAVPGGSAGRVDLPQVVLHPDDAAASGIDEGAEVEVSNSSSGSVRGMARLDANIRQGAISIPHGFDKPNVGRLTSSSVAVDELTGMVLQSGIPVTIAAV